MRKRFPSVLRRICDTAMWACIITAFIWAAIFFVPKIFGYYPFVVQSGSMEPVVHTGSLAYVKMSDGDEEPVADEIYAYRAKDGELVLHRLMGMSDTGYVFKGDANETQDASSVDEGAIVGRFVLSVPDLGYAGAWVSSHGVDIGPLRLPAVVLIAISAILMLNVFCNIAETACRDRNRE